jgi:hypothetical protein
MVISVSKGDRCRAWVQCEEAGHLPISERSVSPFAAMLERKGPKGESSVTRRVIPWTMSSVSCVCRTRYTINTVLIPTAYVLPSAQH